MRLTVLAMLMMLADCTVLQEGISGKSSDMVDFADFQRTRAPLLPPDFESYIGKYFMIHREVSYCRCSFLLIPKAHNLDIQHGLSVFAKKSAYYSIMQATTLWIH